MTAPREFFKGCTTREQARQRLAAWVDQSHDELVRTIAADMLVSEGDVEDIPAGVLELRAFLAGNRAECLAQFERALDEFLGPAREDA